MSVFTWPVITDTSGGGKFNIAKAEFADYSQAVGIGIDNDRQNWSVSFFGTEAQCNEVLAWIRERGSVGGSFQWKPPLSAMRWFRCTEYKVSLLGGMKYVLSLEFEPGAEP